MSKVNKKPSVLERIMEELKANPEGCFQVELADKLGSSASSVNYVIRSQSDRGFLKAQSILKKGRWQVFVSLPEVMPEGDPEPDIKPKNMSLIDTHLHTLRNFPNRHAWSINMGERSHG
ncbi:hypothetical protein [Motilimonas cestriensis]|uniref:hypothetical protein n=1 Tax=Motilimonas cestriensis TaxID=2742685 RepID=UPI003DA69723